MVEWAVFLAGVFVVMVLTLWSATTINYQVTPTHLKITWLALPVRRIRLDDIRYISTRPTWWAEKWYSTPAPGKRLLAIHRRSGLCKTLIITPEKVYVFRNELQRAVAELTTGAPSGPPQAIEARKAA